MTEFLDDRSVLARPAAAPDAVVRYGDLEEQIADVRYAQRNASRPLVILIHGGFWRPQFDRKHTGPMAVAIAQEGWTVASIEYRRVPGNPDATLNDISLAIARLPALVNHHGGKAIVIGHSAGGHLALWAATKCASPTLIGAVALGPAADLQYGFAHNIGDGAVLAFLGLSPAERPDVDPLALPSPQTPTTIVHGIQDVIAPIAMTQNYVARHVNTHLVQLDDCGHFAVIDPLSAAWPRVIEALNRQSSI